MKTIHTVTIQFPEIALQTRVAHKLRGYLGALFKERSPLLHNHMEDGRLRYKYPLVQYKVIHSLNNSSAANKPDNNIPTLVGMEEGANLLTDLFLKIKEINIEGTVYPVLSKNITSKNFEIGIAEDLYNYRFQTLWMGLNQENFQKYRQSNPDERQDLVKKILVSNILAFYKAFDLMLDKNERILAKPELKEKQTRFKDRKMIAFEGHFTTNAMLPEIIGIGKAVSRGFGTIVKL